MDNRSSPLYWSFSCGTLFGTQVRISVYFPLLLLVICLRFGWELGAVFTAILFLSIALHEFGHVFAARRTGGYADEILIWPLGGLAFVQPAERFASRMWTSAGGPLVNFVICLAILPWVLQTGQASLAFNPLVMPVAEIGSPAWPSLLLLTFFANWISLLINLVPVYPLDGGQMLKTVLARYGGESAVTVYLRIGFLVALVVMFAGLIADNTWLVFIGAIVFGLNVQESVRSMMQSHEMYDDSFMGYDFSQGYTSLEREDEREEESAEPEPARPGLIARWKERRREERERREAELDAEVELQLDELLEKINAHGIESLTAAERRLLDRASERYREKNG